MDTRLIKFLIGSTILLCLIPESMILIMNIGWLNEIVFTVIYMICFFIYMRYVHKLGVIN